MALTFGNMDQQVQQQADVFSNNPAALQQRYQQSQQLLDLLALQKIKSDKEAAAREMQMQMEQRPQTIAQQREAEVMGLTKDELAKQMGGIMAQRQSAEQSNIKRAAAGQPPGQRMAMAPPPQMGGVAGQPAPNMINMAQGGVVGFQPGGEVEAPIQEELLKSIGISVEDFMKFTDAEKQRVLETINSRRYLNRAASTASNVGASLRDIATIPQNLVSRGLGELGRISGVLPAEAPDPSLGGARTDTFTPQLDRLERLSQRNQPISMAALSTPGPMMAGIGGDLAFDTLRPVPPAAAPQTQAQAQAQAQAPALAAPAAGIAAVPRVAAPTFGDYRAQEGAIGDSYRKQGILDEYKNNEARRAKMIADQQAARTRNPLRGLMTGASAFGRMGRGIAATREAEAAADLRNLGLEIGDVTKRLGVEEKISGAQITGATDRIKSATAVAVANANNETKAAVSKASSEASNYAAQLQARYRNAANDNEKRKIAVDAQKAEAAAIANILKIQAKDLASLTLSGLKGEDLTAAKKSIEDRYKPLIESYIESFNLTGGGYAFGNKGYKTTNTSA
mgnify:CR=1 FL=1|jgi:hypothetical protein